MPPSVMAALITPFGGDGTIDGGAHRHNLAVLADQDIRGFLIGGSTGQGPYLEPGERFTLMAAARTELGDDPFLLAGVSAQSVRQANAQIDELADTGTDAVLVVTPTFLLRADADSVVAFFNAVADHSPLPVFLYTVPAVTGYELPVDATVVLAAHRSIAGMKDSGGDIARIGPILEGTGEDFVLFTGASRAVHAAVREGAHGAITASANYVPDLVIAAQVDGPTQDRLTATVAIVEQYGIAGTYAAAEIAGLSPGVMRAPLLPLADRVRSGIGAVLGAARSGTLATLSEKE